MVKAHIGNSCLLQKLHSWYLVSEQKCSVSGVFDRISFYFIYISILMDADGHCQNFCSVFFCVIYLFLCSTDHMAFCPFSHIHLIETKKTSIFQHLNSKAPWVSVFSTTGTEGEKNSDVCTSSARYPAMHRKTKIPTLGDADAKVMCQHLNREVRSFQ